eukprot:gb/GECH01007648.1/.p1 GENE.gb/GECH01007648.1/~~gb/GECH01007648.1/.p1  ORF type:complete len:665 (+),score=188.45 gb/GECH01007648.1/:1-1995(+)
MTSDWTDVNRFPKFDDDMTWKPIVADPSKLSSDIGEGVRRRTGFEDNLLKQPYDSVSTLYENFDRAIKKWPDRRLFGYRPVKNGSPQDFVWYTYKEAAEHAFNAMSALYHLGVSEGDKVAIYSKNRPEWQMVAQGCSAYSLVSVALYDSLGPDASKYIVDHAEIKVITVSGECLPRVFDFVKTSETVTHIVCFDDVSDEQKETAKECNVEIIDWKQLLKLGEENRREPIPPKSDDLAVLMYTSGTTGNPKGVMLTHQSIISARAGIHTFLFQLSEQDSFLSFLPLAHILGRVAEELLIGEGIRIGYYGGDVKNLVDDIQTLKPTILAVVPRVLEKIFDRIQQKVKESNFLRRWMANHAIQSKKFAIEHGTSAGIWDWLVINKLKTTLGGRMRAIVSGGAPLRPDIQEFLRAAFDVPIMQGYGLTETCAMATIQPPNVLQTNISGTVVPCVEIKLVDVEEMDYKSTNTPPQGEICIRGTAVMQGYYKNEEKTKEALDDDGWFHSGDIGQWNSDGSLTIIDRLKNMFKLAQGEYVAAELLEGFYKTSKYVNQIFVYGDSMETSLVAVVVLDEGAAMNFVKSNNGSAPSSLQEACNNDALRQEVLKDLNRIATERKRNGFEKIRAVHLEHEPFDEQGLMTPTMKLIRNKLKSRYDNEIKEMYQSLKK